MILKIVFLKEEKFRKSQELEKDESFLKFF